MSQYFRSGDSKTLHIVVPGPWKDFLEKRAKQNNRALSDEVRRALQLAYDLEDKESPNEEILPEAFRREQ